jgi:hypothetical protein
MSMNDSPADSSNPKKPVGGAKWDKLRSNFHTSKSAFSKIKDQKPIYSKKQMKLMKSIAKQLRSRSRSKNENQDSQIMSGRYSVQ